MSNDPILSLSTEAAPGIPVEIDGELYEIRSIESFSTADEIQLRTLYTRERRLQELLEQTPADQETRIQELSEKLADVRIKLIELMTNIPRSVIEKLPVPAQLRLVAVIAGTSPEEVLTRGG